MSQEEKVDLQDLIKEAGKDIRKEIIKILGMAFSGLCILSATFYYNTNFKIQTHDDLWVNQKQINADKVDRQELMLYKENLKQRLDDLDRDNEELKRGQERTINLIIEAKRQ